MLQLPRTRRSLSHQTKITDFMKQFIETNHRETITPQIKQIKQLKSNKVNEKCSNVYKVELPNVQQNLCLKQRNFNNQEKERELMMLKAISKYKHPCIIEMRHHFANNSQINIVFDYLPMNLQQVIGIYKERNKKMPIILIKLFTFQLLRAVSHLHEFSICHRNIQPNNILIDNETFELKLSDFSQAKFLHNGEDSINTVNNVQYRAPELLLGASKYDKSIDLWSIGCVIYEMLTLNIAFEGNTQEEVLAEIIKILGVPKKHELQAMHSQIEDLKMPQIKRKEWENSEIIEFIKQFIKYIPIFRGKAQDYLKQDFFKNIISGQIRLNGKELPNINNFTSIENRYMSYF